MSSLPFQTYELLLMKMCAVFLRYAYIIKSIALLLLTQEFAGQKLYFSG